MKDQKHLERRHFLKLALGGVVIGLVGCVDDTFNYMPRRGPTLVDGGNANDSGRGLPPGQDASVSPPGQDASVNPPQQDANVNPPQQDANVNPPTPDAEPTCTETATVYDLYAQSLYFSGEYGPETGNVTAAQIAAGAALDMQFWHEHGGVYHRFTVTQEHLRALARGERVDITTDEVEGHSHNLFIDPASTRVAGGGSAQVPLC